MRVSLIELTFIGFYNRMKNEIEKLLLKHLLFLEFNQRVFKIARVFRFKVTKAD